jgi:hypothetical protein
VGVQSLEQNATDWYGRDPRFGMGRRECKHLESKVQVGNHRFLVAFIHTGSPACCQLSLSSVHCGSASLLYQNYLPLCKDRAEDSSACFLQVRHRCRCQDLIVCGEEALLVEKLARRGDLVPNAKPAQQDQVL